MFGEHRIAVFLYGDPIQLERVSGAIDIAGVLIDHATNSVLSHCVSGGGAADISKRAAKCSGRSGA